MIPDSESLTKALEALASEIPDKYIEMLRVHYRAPNQMITATEMAASLGYKNYGGANLHYGKLAGMIKDYLGITEHEDVNISVIVSFIMPGEQNNEEIIWVLRPEVASALEKLNWT